MDNWDTKAVFVRAKYLAPEAWYDGRGDAASSAVVDFFVGGNTEF